MPFQIENLKIDGVKLIKPQMFGDQRGIFLEQFKQSDFKEASIEQEIKQINFSRSEKGVLRGLHWQIEPRPQAKIISVIKGTIFDVAVDLRPDSPSFKKWVGVELDDNERKMIYVPAGLAHGFCVLSETAEVQYTCSEEYAPGLEQGLIWNDSVIGIEWPIEEPILSERDQSFPKFSDLEL